MKQHRDYRTAPAVAVTAVSMVLTLAVVVMWLGQAMPWPIALVVGLGLDGAWLATLAYERRMAAQGDHSTPVAVVGWCFGAVAAGVLVAHALTAETNRAAWLAVAWLPLAAKALWFVHGLWERTELTSDALGQIRAIRQGMRDQTAVARARLLSEAGAEEIRLATVTAAGARVAHVQAEAAQTLSEAWQTLTEARETADVSEALTSVSGGVTPGVTARVTPGVTPRWELPVLGPVTTLPALAEAEPEPLTDGELDEIIRSIRDAQDPPLSYRETSRIFRSTHKAAETRLRESWNRVTRQQEAG